MYHPDEERPGGDGAGVVLWLFAIIGGLVLALFVLDSYAQEPALTEPRGATLIIPGGASVLDGNINVLPSAVDAIVRQQTPEYLQRVTASLLPRPQDFTVGRIEGGPGPAIPAYISGRVTENATRVQFRVDGVDPYYEASTLRVTRAGYPKVWTWVIPEKYQDGKAHKVYARALRSTGTVIGPLDNAKSAAQWTFTIGALPPPVPPPVPPVVTPEIVAGKVSYDATAGVITVETAPGVLKVEVLIDSRDVSPWYLGVREPVSNKATFLLPPDVRDGRDHLLDVRLYTVDKQLRPDVYPITVKLTPPLNG